jgi:hypothetical protein
VQAWSSLQLLTLLSKRSKNEDKSDRRLPSLANVVKDVPRRRGTRTGGLRLQLSDATRRTRSTPTIIIFPIQLIDNFAWPEL